MCISSFSDLLNCKRRDMGYDSKFLYMQRELDGRFGQNITWSSKTTSESTGYFEVEVDGRLVHSKKRGDGFVDTAEKKQKIADAIQAILFPRKTF